MYQQGFFEDKWNFINSVKANIVIDRRESLPTKQDEKKNYFKQEQSLVEAVIVRSVTSSWSLPGLKNVNQI